MGLAQPEVGNTELPLMKRFAASGPLSGIDRFAALRAVARYARATGERTRSREYLEHFANVDWSGQEPTIRDHTHDMAASVELAAMLLDDGDATRGRRLLRAVLRVIEQEAKVRGDMWYGVTRPQALALLGENDAVIEALRKSFEAGFMTSWWERLEDEPAYTALRRDPRFVAILEHVHNRVAAQRLQLEAMRVAGAVPARVSANRTRADADPRTRSLH